MCSIQIRRAEIQDSKELESLLNQLGYRANRRELESYLSRIERTDEVYVAIASDVIIGLMSLMIFDYFPTQEKICRITSIVVTENRRGLGIGTKLIGFANNMAKSIGVRQIEITTSLLREMTQKYYESLGFKKTSFRYVRDVSN